MVHIIYGLGWAEYIIRPYPQQFFSNERLDDFGIFLVLSRFCDCFVSV